MATLRRFLFVSLLGLTLAACSHLDITPGQQGDRVLKGTVSFHMPENAGKISVLVRLVDVTSGDSVVLGEQTVDGKGSPVSFEIPYKAEDIAPPKHAQLEARVSVDGRLRFFNLNACPVTPDNAQGSIDVWVDRVR